MAIEVKNFDNLIEVGKDNKYVLVKGPRMFVGPDSVEHKTILNEAGFKRENVLAAGGYLTYPSGKVEFDCFGSESLNVPQKSPKKVCDFLKSLPGSEGKTIIVD